MVHSTALLYPSAVLVLPEAREVEYFKSWQIDCDEHIRSRIN